MTAAWSGSARLRPGRLAFGGAIGATSAHAHHSVQVIAATDGELTLAGPSGGGFGCRAAVVPADSPHTVLTGVPSGVLIHYAPESRAGRRLARLTVDGGPEAWVRTGALLIPEELPDDPALAAHAVERLVDAAVDDGPPLGRTARHSGLAEVLRTLPGQLAAGQVRLGQAARVAGLSESRLSHLFRSQLGLPFRSYVLWLRLQRATELVAAGCSLTEAAHGAGFADQAHLTRVCRRMFGIAPSSFTRHAHWSA
ncbi:helix-turn-helix domain-containing protein [Streptomyces sp. O3]